MGCKQAIGGISTNSGVPVSNPIVASSGSYKKSIYFLTDKIPTIYGDASREGILEKAGVVNSAKMIIVIDNDSSDNTLSNKYIL